MTPPSHTGRDLVVSLPVADVERSTTFFAQLGFAFDPAMTGEAAAKMLIGEQASVMLLSHDLFAQFSKLPTADPATHTLALYTVGVAARDDVDAVAEAAMAAGGREADPGEDHGFMYSRSFFDLDGHGWQVVWMNPAATQPGGESPAADEAGAPA